MAEPTEINDWVEGPPPPAVNDWVEGPPPDPDKHSVGGFLGNVVGSGANFAGAAYNAVRHPLNTAANIAQTGYGALENMGDTIVHKPGPEDASQQKADAVGHLYKDRYGSLAKAGETLYHDPVGVAADVSTVLDPAGAALKGGAAIADAAHATQVADAMRGAGNVAGKAAGAINPGAIPSHVVGAVADKILPIDSTLNPIEKAAVNYALNEGAPVDLANATGNGAVASVKSLLQKQPSSARVAGKFAQDQEDWLRNKATDVARNIAPGGPKTKLNAGVQAQQEIASQLSNYRAQADAAYQKLYQQAEAKPETVQVGTKPNPSLDPTQPDRIPVMAQVAGPVSTASVKAAATPMLQEVEATIPLAQQQMSPAVALLRQIIARPDVVDLKTAMQDNSALQNVARNETTPQLRTQAQRISSALVSPYRAAIDGAAQKLGPDAFQALQDGRQATISKYELGQAIPRQVNGSPVNVVKFLTAGDDKSVPVLQKIQQHAPNAIPGIARATIEDIFSHSTENGGFSRVDGTLNKWNALGDQTKQILFGPQTSDEISQLLHFAKVAGKNANPSGSAGVGTTAALATLLMRDPMTAIAAMAGSRALARGIFNTDVASEVARTGRIQTPQIPSVARVAAAPLNSHVITPATRINPYQQNPYK